MEKTAITVRIPKSLAERFKNTVYGIQDMNQKEFLIEALSSHIGQYEREYREGQPYPPRKIKR